MPEELLDFLLAYLQSTKQLLTIACFNVNTLLIFLACQLMWLWQFDCQDLWNWLQNYDWVNRWKWLFWNGIFWGKCIGSWWTDWNNDPSRISNTVWFCLDLFYPSWSYQFTAIVMLPQSTHFMNATNSIYFVFKLIVGHFQRINTWLHRRSSWFAKSSTSILLNTPIK